MSERSVVLDLLRQRRSIRKYQPQPVEAAKVALLIEAALRAPTSRGRNPWEFVVVTDPDRLRALSRAKPHGAGFLAEAPLAVVVAADPRRCDVWIEDCAIAAILLQLAALSVGLGSCWVQIRQRPHGDGGTAEAHVREVVGLPDHLAVACIIGIGYPAEPLPGHPTAGLPADRVHRERFGGK